MRLAVNNGFIDINYSLVLRQRLKLKIRVEKDPLMETVSGRPFSTFSLMPELLFGLATAYGDSCEKGL